MTFTLNSFHMLYLGFYTTIYNNSEEKTREDTCNNKLCDLLLWHINYLGWKLEAIMSENLKCLEIILFTPSFREG